MTRNKPQKGLQYDSSCTLASVRLPEVRKSLICLKGTNILFANKQHSFSIFQVRIALYKNGSEVLSMLFDAVGTNKLNWFSQAKLLSSPWSDLKTASSLQHFDIIGSVQRYFEISSRYNNCSTDVGWLEVGNGVCRWERNGSNSSNILFSKLNVSNNWNNFGKGFSFIKSRLQ